MWNNDRSVYANVFVSVHVYERGGGQREGRGIEREKRWLGRRDRKREKKYEKERETVKRYIYRKRCEKERLQ